MADNNVLTNPMLSFMLMQNPAEAMQLQQQQALAAQLMQQASAPIDTANRSTGRLIAPVSPLEALAKVGQGAAAGYMQKQNNQKYADMLSGGSSPSQPALDASMSNGQGPTAANDQTLRAVSGNSPSSAGLPSLTGDPRKDMMIYLMDKEAYTKGVVDQYGGTNEMKLAAALNPKGSPQYLQDLRNTQNKNSYIAPENVRQGSVVIDPISHQPVFNNSAVPDNTTPVFGTRGDGTQGTIGAQRLPILPPGSPQSGNAPPANGAAPDNNARMTSIPPIPEIPKEYLPAGPAETAAATATGKSNADMVNSLRTMAADSPIRQDTYDKIINLSKAGVSTGGGAEMYNNIKNYAVNTPVLGPLAEKLTGNPSDYQELNKFLKRNAVQSWQAAGGTGTDAQLEANTEASANAKMTPQALQAVAQYGKAGEMALNAKNNFMQSSIGQNNENVSKANQFENQWKEHFDPKVYQLALTGGDPKQMQQITSGMSAAQKTILMGKYQYAKQNGWLQ